MEKVVNPASNHLGVRDEKDERHKQKIKSMNRKSMIILNESGLGERMIHHENRVADSTGE
jgi:hypothetical protein